MMTIHLKINGKEIDRIEVINRGKTSKRGLYMYRIKTDDDEDIIVHKRSEGSRVLAERVLRNLTFA